MRWWTADATWHREFVLILLMSNQIRKLCTGLQSNIDQCIACCTPAYRVFSCYQYIEKHMLHHLIKKKRDLVQTLIFYTVFFDLACLK